MHTARMPSGFELIADHGNGQSLQIFDIDSGGNQAGAESALHHTRGKRDIAGVNDGFAGAEHRAIGRSQFGRKFGRDLQIAQSRHLGIRKQLAIPAVPPDQTAGQHGPVFNFLARPDLDIRPDMNLIADYCRLGNNRILANLDTITDPATIQNQGLLNFSLFADNRVIPDYRINQLRFGPDDAIVADDRIGNIAIGADCHTITQDRHAFVFH